MNHPAQRPCLRGLEAARDPELRRSESARDEPAEMRRIGDVAENRQDHAEQVDHDEQARERHQELCVRPEIDAP